MRPTVTRQALLDALATGATATSVLEALVGAPLVIERQPGPALALPASARGLLDLAAGESIHYRRVHLIAAGIHAAEGDLWYLPERLWPGMEASLASTDQPFGAVIARLGPVRQTLRARICGADEPISLEVSALVLTAQGRPIAYVEERFLVGIGS